MNKRRLVMNLTPLLDLIIILFFAQSLLLTDQSQRVEQKADDAVAQMQAEIRESNVRHEREIGDREQRIARQEAEIERQFDEQQRIRQDLLDREKAYASAFEGVLDVNRFLDLLQQSDLADGAENTTPNVADETQRRKAAERFAQSYVIMRKSAEALENHITVWIFYICYNSDTDRYHLEFQVNDETVELSREIWDFDSEERLYNRLVRELTANPSLPTPPGPVFPMWGTKGDVAKRVRDTFRTVLPSALQEVNTIYTNDPTIGGKGWPNTKIHSGSIAPLGNIPFVAEE
jgi:hypothetical protein